MCKSSSNLIKDKIFQIFDLLQKESGKGLKKIGETILGKIKKQTQKPVFKWVLILIKGFT
jgi:hypothetical protein